jgi:1,4-alpha-glucan branching enzyme
MADATGLGDGKNGKRQSMPKVKATKQKVTFSYKAPEAKAVLLAGDFTGWQQAPLSMKKDKAGLWKKSISLPPGRYEYRLLVDGDWQDDPGCPTRQPNQFGGENCVCVVNGSTPAGSDG